MTAMSEISGNTGAQGGGLYLSQSTARLSNVTVDENNATEGYGGGIAAVQQSAVNLSSVSVSSNSALTHGGGMLAVSTATRLSAGCMVEGNTVNDLGGGFYWGCDCISDCSTSQIDATTLGNNTALGGGGLYEAGCAIGARWPDLQAALTGSEQTSRRLDNNTAVYGALVASALTFVNVMQSGSIWSGEPVVANSGSQLLVRLLDRYRQTIKDPTGRGQLLGKGLELSTSTADSRVLLKGTVSAVDASSGDADFGFLKITAPIGSTVTLGFTADTSPAISAQFNVTLQHCRIGAIPPATNIGECQECPVGKYSIAVRATECLPCPDGAVCNGAASIQAAKDYWVPALTSKSSVPSAYYSCPFTSCLGGVSAFSSNSTGGRRTQVAASMHYSMGASPCKVGYTGVVCALCTDGYSLTPNGCTLCESSGGGSIEPIGYIILAVLALVLLAAALFKLYWMVLGKRNDMQTMINQLFAAFDKNHDGILEPWEIRSALHFATSDNSKVSRWLEELLQQQPEHGIDLAAFKQLLQGGSMNKTIRQTLVVIQGHEEAADAGRLMHVSRDLLEQQRAVTSGLIEGAGRGRFRQFGGGGGEECHGSHGAHTEACVRSSNQEA